jgi:hypothetical protein
MRKIHLLGLALLAVLALGATMAASAFAAPGEWLINGAAFTGTRNVQTIGLLTLIRLKSSTNTGILNEVDCEGTFDGTVTQSAAGVKGTDTITEILNTADEKVTELVEPTNLPLNCTVTQTAGEFGDCNLGPASVWPDNLTNAAGPWLTELLELEANGLVLDGLFGKGVLGEEPGYEVECTTAIGKASQLCEGPTESDLTNGASDVIGIFSLEVSPETECITAGVTEEKVAATVGEGLICIITSDLVCSTTEILSVS